MLGSNQRRLSRRFYRPLSSHPSHTPLTSTYTPRGRVPGRRRPPCVRAPRDPRKPARATDRKTRGHGRQGGSGYADRPPGSPALPPPKIHTERADQRIQPSRLTPRRNRRPVGRSYFRAEQVTAQSTWQKSVASIVMPACAGTAATSRLCAAWAPGDLQCLEDPADGGCADPVAELEQLTLDPLVPQPLFLGGEPLDERGDLGADWRSSCPVRAGPLAGDQAAMPVRTVPGVTSRCIRSVPGRSRISAARTARSAQSSRGRGLVRRSTATSCRSTRSSASLEADERPSRTSQPQSRTKTR